MSVPFEIRDDAKHGRGLYALRKIKRGEMVWFSNRRVQFFREKQFRNFIDALPKRYHESAFMWAWSYTNQKGQQVIGLVLDEGSLVNHSPQPNTGTHPFCDAMKSNYLRLPCLENNYALRDIEAGEELTDNYEVYDEEESIRGLTN